MASIEVFFSYSHRDEALRDELAKHLSSLQWEGIISSWHDRKIIAGDEWDGKIKTYLNTADVILLLISADFIFSRYCREIEIQRALERHELGEALVIPVILRPVDWTSTPFGNLQALPKNAEPVISKAWGSQDEAFLNVAQGIRTAAKSLLERRQQTVQFERQAAAALAQQQKLRGYREEVEQLVTEDEGVLSDFSQNILLALRNSLKLTDEEAIAIEEEVLKPYETKKANLREYEKLFAIAFQQQYPFTESTTNRLKRLQQKLNLSAEDVRSIEQRTVEGGIKPPVAESVAPRPAAVPNQPRPKPAATKLDDLASEKGIDYTRLQNLLKAQQWQEANDETYQVMLLVVGRGEADWIRSEELLSFPCTDLRTIDRLWAEYSEDRFGFSVQKQIYLSVGGKLDSKYDAKIWSAFGDRVGWRVKGNWIFKDEIRFSTSAPKGHLPFWGWGSWFGLWLNAHFGGELSGLFFSRIAISNQDM